MRQLSPDDLRHFFAINLRAHVRETARRAIEQGTQKRMEDAADRIARTLTDCIATSGLRVVAPDMLKAGETDAIGWGPRPGTFGVDEPEPGEPVEA